MYCIGLLVIFVPFQHKDYATQTIHLMKEHVLTYPSVSTPSSLGHVRLSLRTAMKNTAGIRLAKRAGLIEEGTSKVCVASETYYERRSKERSDVESILARRNSSMVNDIRATLPMFEQWGASITWKEWAAVREA